VSKFAFLAWVWMTEAEDCREKTSQEGETE
ncbi:hypothetical protein LCGC14_1685630, partial [marine sediment metagenome]